MTLKRMMLAVVTTCALAGPALAIDDGGHGARPDKHRPKVSVSAKRRVARAPSATSAAPGIRLRFVNSDVSDVLQAIAIRTGANIVFPAQVKKQISIDVTAANIGEALSLATAPAGLIFRQIGRTYLVAEPADMRRVLESFGEKAMLETKGLAPDAVVKLLSDALPYLTARPAGSRVAITGSPEDLQAARELMNDQVEPALPVAPERVASDVAVLEHVSAMQIAKLIRSIYPGLKVEAIGSEQKAGGSIGVTGPASQVEGAKETIRKVDVSTIVRVKETAFRVYRIRYSSAGELRVFLEKAAPDVTVVVGPESFSPPMPNFRPLAGALQSAISSTGGSGGGGNNGGSSSITANTAANEALKQPGERAKLLVLSGDPAAVESCLKVLAEVDVAPQQVLVEVRVVDTSPEIAEELGIKWDWSPMRAAETAIGTVLGSTVGIPALPTGQPGFGAFSRVPFDVRAIIGAMVTRKDAKILADPRIQVLDNDDANIFIGDTLRTQVSQASISGTTIQVLEFPVGIILLVRPRINTDGQITMRVHPVVSTVTGIGAGNLPQTSSREAETTVRIKDGETVVIGGLIRDEMTKTIQEIPILSKLPLVGELFRNRSTNHRHSEILVFITPHIIKENGRP